MWEFLEKNMDFWVGQRPAGSDQSPRITDLKLKHWEGRFHFFSVLYSPLILRHNAVHSEVAERMFLTEFPFMTLRLDKVELYLFYE